MMFIKICNQDQFSLCHFNAINALVVILLAMLMVKQFFLCSLSSLYTRTIPVETTSFSMCLV